jgi:hypothetical protein
MVRLDRTIWRRTMLLRMARMRRSHDELSTVSRRLRRKPRAYAFEPDHYVRIRKPRSNRASPSRFDIPRNPRGLSFGFGPADANILQLTRVQPREDASATPRLPHQRQAIRPVAGRGGLPGTRKPEKHGGMVGHLNLLGIRVA